MPELVPEAEHPLFGARLLLVSASTTEHGVELVVANSAQQRVRLQAIATGTDSGVLDDASGVDVVLHAGDDKTQVEAIDRLVAEFDHLVEIVTGVDVHHSERQWGRPECLGRYVQHHDGILTSGEQEDRLFESRCDFAENMDRLRFECSQMRQLVGGRGLECCHVFRS